VFATNRVVIENAAADPSTSFSNEESGQLSYGSCQVNIPVQHQRGKLELPSWWQKRNPAKHFLVESFEILTESDFHSAIRPGDLLLFVHGYRTSFEHAVLRAAQLRYDMEFPGPVAAFSWPSAASLTAYDEDRKKAARSAPRLAELLAGLVAARSQDDDEASSPKIHVLAHSMGNLILLDAVCRLYEDDHFQPGRPVLGQVILAAPDVGAIQFNNMLPYLMESAERVTYYYCNHDAALAASRKINYYEPVGMFPYFDEGLDTINADGVGTTFISHGYYASSREVLEDIRLLLLRQWPPPQRMPPLVAAAEVFGHRCWSFTPITMRQDGS
jgi:esterase/lipase superfamily enzyme